MHSDNECFTGFVLLFVSIPVGCFSDELKRLTFIKGVKEYRFGTPLIPTYFLTFIFVYIMQYGTGIYLALDQYQF